MPREDLGRLRALDVDDVEAEGCLHRRGDFARTDPERHVLELLDHDAAPEPAQLTALRCRRAVIRESLRGRGEVCAMPELDHQRFGALERLQARRRIRRRLDDDLSKRNRRRSLGLLILVLVPEFPHLCFRRRDGPELALLPLRFDQTLRKQLPALLVAQPPPPFFDGAKPRLPDLIAKVVLGAELLADVLVGLLHLIEDFLIGDFDRRIALRVLHQDFQLYQPVQNLAPERREPRGVGRQRHPLRLLLNHFFVDLRRQDGARAHDRDDAIERLVRCRWLLRGGGRDHGQKNENRFHRGGRPLGWWRAVSIGGGPGAGVIRGGPPPACPESARSSPPRSAARRIPASSTLQRP